ncbi:Hexose_transporter [Hexamita inflata]|uniref:Hexose transporter n=1 Tax=Hexamita inflata TaxID=28002 RepID=A0AA86VF65_9EUKA|nr:Hexose transporter [Hexamita inflata]
MNYNIIMFLVYLAGGFVRGTALNNLSGVIIQMYSNLSNHFDTKGQIMAFLSTCIMCGSMLGTFTATPIILKLGRKVTIGLMGLLCLLSSIAAMIPLHWIYLAIMKILAGLSSSVIMTTVPMLFSEFVAPKLRGTFSSLMNLFICFGTLLTAVIQLYIAPYDKLFYVAFIPGACSSLLLLVLTFWVKEVSTSNNLVVPAENTKLESIFNIKYRKCLLIALTLGPAQAGSGMYAVVQYATLTFANSFNSPYSGTIGFIIVAFSNTLAATIAIPFIKRVSRRKLWFSSLIGCMICQLAQIILSFININENTLAYLKLTFTIAFLIFFQFGIGPLYLAILAELFPLEVKTKLMNFGMVMFWTVLITTTLLFPLIPKWTSYLIFLGIQTICMIVLFINLPETTGKTLQEIRKIMVIEEPKVEIKPAAHAEAPLE